METQEQQSCIHKWELNDLPSPEHMAPILYEVWRQKKYITGVEKWLHPVTGEDLLLGWEHLSSVAKREDIDSVRVFYLLLDVMMSQIDLLG